MQQQYKKKLEEMAQEVIEILATKDDAYGSSWKSKGGFSAFFNLERKWARTEYSAKLCDYDIFRAVREIPGCRDALKDLVGYAILVLAETENDPAGPRVEQDTDRHGG